MFGFLIKKWRIVNVSFCIHSLIKFFIAILTDSDIIEILTWLIFDIIQTCIQWFFIFVKFLKCLTHSISMGSIIES